MNISEVSEKFQLSQDTLRYYEKAGLIPKVHRNKYGKRDYLKSDLYWIHYVKALRNSGVSIKSIIKYVSLVQQGMQTRDKRKKILLEQKEQLEQRIKETQEALKHLNIKLDIYDEYVVQLEQNTRISDKTTEKEE